MEKSGAGDLFPYGRIREGQREFLADARDALSSSLTLVAHAPTGLGKTAVGLTASLEASEDLVVYMTARQSQHMAVVETVRHIMRKRAVRGVDLIAMEDMCLATRKEGGVPCQRGEACYFHDRKRIAEAAKRLLQYPLHAQEGVRTCLRMGACPYHAAMEASKEADLVVCDYNQMFNVDAEGVLSRAGREEGRGIAVVDEAHNLPQRIMEAGSADIEVKEALRLSRSLRARRFRPELEAIGHLAQRAERGRVDQFWLSDHLLDKFDRDLADLVADMQKHAAITADAGLLRLALSLRNWARFGEESVRYADGYGGLHCRFISPGLVASEVIGRLRACLLMSGTLYPPQHFAETLGIADICGCRAYPSPFPKENRLLLSVGGVTTRYDRRSPAMFASMATCILEACQHIPGNVAAFFPSYELMRAVQEHLEPEPGGKRQVMERREFGKHEREAILADLRAGSDALLLAPVTGSLAEGIDFSDNLLSAVIVAGVPYAPPSPESEELQSRLEKRMGRQQAIMRVSTYPALTKVLQAAGRAIRSETDRAAILLLDDRFSQNGLRSALPGDMPLSTSLDLGAELDRFFGSIPQESPVAEEVKVS